MKCVMNFQSRSTAKHDAVLVGLDWILSYLLIEFEHGATTIIDRIFAKYYTRTAAWNVRVAVSVRWSSTNNWRELYGHALGLYTAHVAYDTS